MTNLVKRFSSNDGNEQIGAVNQESLTIGPSELRKELVAGRGIESIVNSLVSKRNFVDAHNVFDEMPCSV